MTLDECCKAVISESKRPYAITYARAMTQARSEALQMGQGEAYGERMQIPYILSNLGHWRGERAREVKTALKLHLKNLKG